MIQIATRRILSLLMAMVLLVSAGAWAESSMVSEEEWAAAVEADSREINKGDWTNILLLGCDSYSKNNYSRSDSMIILSINTKTYAVKMTSLMRDTWVKSERGSHKLTELCAIGGPELTMKTINEKFDMDISDYMLINMAGIAEIIDLLGGLELDITEAERKAINKGLFDLSGLSGMEKLQQSGEKVHLNGNQATAYARIRKIDSDYVRVERQRIVLLAMAEKILNGASASTLLNIVDALLDYVVTNMSFMEIMSLAGFGLKMDLSAGVEEFRLPADGTYESGMYGNVWCIKPNFEQNASLLHKFIYG